jgi:hypothetical protein
VIPPLLWLWPLPGLLTVLLVSAAIADARVMQVVGLVRGLAALVLVVGLAWRLSHTGPAAWTDLADLLRPTVSGG